MRIIGRSVLQAFCVRCPECRNWISNWVADAERTTWQTPQAIKDRYSTASFLAGNLFIFNVRGNQYRLEVRLAYRTGTVLIVWIGTHAEYSRRHG
jgi:mRNA interferase HigB